MRLTCRTPKTSPCELNMVRAEPFMLPAMGRRIAMMLRWSHTCRHQTMPLFNWHPDMGATQCSHLLYHTLLTSIYNSSRVQAMYAS